jgi:hypothetical protein
MSKRLLVRDQRGERERLLVGTMSVGRDTRCDISDADPLLSRRHAEFVCAPDSLTVRDLDSRNGIAVNGVKVKEAVLRPGDVVKIAGLVMTYLGDHEPFRSISSSPTAAVGRPAPPPVPPPHATNPPPPRTAPTGDDGRVPDAAAARRGTPQTARISSGSHNGPGAAGAVPADDRTALVERRSPQRSAPPGQVVVAQIAPPLDDFDRTRPIVREGDIKTETPVPSPSAPRQGAPTAGLPSVPAAAPPAAPQVPPPLASIPPPTPTAGPPAEVRPLDDWTLAPRTGPVDTPRVHRVPVQRTSGVGLLIASVGLALLVFALTALPLTIQRGWVAESQARAQSLAMANAFAAEAGAALQLQGAAGLGPVADRTRTTDGVTVAVIMWADGRIAAPANLAGRRVTRIPALNVSVDAVRAAECASHDGVFEAAAPVRAAGGTRAAVVWLTYRPGTPSVFANPLVVLGPALMCSLAAAVLLAWWIGRLTTIA